MRRTPLAAASLSAAALFLGACGGEEEAGPTDDFPTNPAAATSPPTEPVTTGAPEPEAQPKRPLEDGRHFGYIRAANVTGEGEPRELVFDLAYFLSGEEANEAAAERGFETPVANDYFVVNDNPKLRTLPVAADVVIDLVDWKRCCEKRLAGDPERFEAAFAASEHSAGQYRGEFSSYWLTVEDGVVTRIEEQYLP